MTSSRRPTMWNRWPFSNALDWTIAIPAALFVVMLIHGSFLGLTDDEAYYWVLAQKPALGYAYHPPAVAWWIAASQWLLSPFLGRHNEAIVRFASSLSSSAFLFLALRWSLRAGIKRAETWRVALILISVAGLFGLSWMMVPDIPLFLGWTLAFNATWGICFDDKEFREWRHYLLLAAGVTLSILSKYSAVLGAFSAGMCLLIWAPPARRWRGIAALVVGGLIAAVPIVIWNMNHEWASILYQIRERHEGGSFSLMRWLRFWLIEIVIAGPVLLFFTLGLFRGALAGNRVFRFLLTWLLPGALVFCVQPLFSDFKPHWALIVWWPLALAMGWAWAADPAALKKRAVLQVAWGWGLAALVLVSCHLPVGGVVLRQFRGSAMDPRLDVTNDLYGWSELRSFLLKNAGPDALRLPVVGSRYQTASQASFAIGEGGVGILLPRGIRDRDEWPDLTVSDGTGPAWPRLTQPVYFVADNRYDAGPEFPEAKCLKMGRIEKFRFGIAAKWIDVWRCEPGAARPAAKEEPRHQSL